MTTFVNRLESKPINNQPVEIVERKGFAHPDTICDTIANQMSVDYCRYTLFYLDAIPHHNFDKSLLSAGETRIEWGGGDVVKPMKFYYGDRAINQVGKHKIPVEKICNNAARSVMKDLMNGYYDFDPISAVACGSSALTGIFKSKDDIMPSNDTSATVGYAPLSKVENLLLSLEKHLDNLNLPFLGRDLKFMAQRIGDKLDLTMAGALIATEIYDPETYHDSRLRLEETVYDYLTRNWGDNYVFHFNNLDNKNPESPDEVYLTLSGTSAECGDSGQVGRGNNVAGVIPLCRPMSAEAASGKNPVSHIGRIYNHLAFKIADHIHEELSIPDVYVHMVNRIGDRIDEPSIVNVNYNEGTLIDIPDHNHIKDIITGELNGLGDYVEKLVQGIV